MPRTLHVVLILLLAVAAVSLVGFDPFGPDRPMPEPEVTALEITDQGCRSEIRDFSSSRNGPNGTFVDAGTVDTESPVEKLSARIRRTSPDDAAITTYRVDVRTHTANSTDASCPGRFAYRIEYRAPSGPTGNRAALYLDGEIRGCGGGTSGADIGCHRLMDDDVRTYWSNASAHGGRAR